MLEKCSEWITFACGEVYAEDDWSLALLLPGLLYVATLLYVLVRVLGPIRHEIAAALQRDESR